MVEEELEEGQQMFNEEWRPSENANELITTNSFILHNFRSYDISNKNVEIRVHKWI
jgi:hypothetical protein